MSCMWFVGMFWLEDNEGVGGRRIIYEQEEINEER